MIKDFLFRKTFNLQFQIPSRNSGILPQLYSSLYPHQIPRFRLQIQEFTTLVFLTMKYNQLKEKS
jgi:hypothetical protein